MGTPYVGNMLSKRWCKQGSTGRSTKSLSEVRGADGNRFQSVPFVERDGIAKESVGDRQTAGRDRGRIDASGGGENTAVLSKQATGSRNLAQVGR